MIFFFFLHGGKVAMETEIPPHPLLLPSSHFSLLVFNVKAKLTGGLPHIFKYIYICVCVVCSCPLWMVYIQTHPPQLQYLLWRSRFPHAFLRSSSSSSAASSPSSSSFHLFNPLLLLLPVISPLIVIAPLCCLLEYLACKLLLYGFSLQQQQQHDE